MRPTLALMNLLLGSAYTGYGIITFLDLKRGWRERGFSHFGAAWIFMAFTCGPHHLAHGLHLAIEGRSPGLLDMFAVGVGLPAGLIWLFLRIEAYRGGRGDRFAEGDPAWIRWLPMTSVLYLGLLFLGFWMVILGARVTTFTITILPNLMLLSIYFAIGFLLWKTQIRNRAQLGGWSISGVALGVVFPTCALMHTAWAVYAVSGLYHFDVHGFIIDWLSVPAALYFLWVVSSLQRGTLQDWNASMDKRLGETAPDLVHA